MSPTRIWFRATSKTCCSESLVPLIPNCRMETVDALYWMISGGVVPDGSCLKIVCETAVNCATAVEGFVQWLKENFDYADAVIGGRFNVFDIIDRGRERSFFAVN